MTPRAWGLLSTIFMVSTAAILVFRPFDNALYAAGLVAFTGGLTLLNRTSAKRDPEWSSDPETRVYPQLLAVRLVAINVMFVSGLAQLDWLMWTGAAILAATLPIGPLVSLRRAKKHMGSPSVGASAPRDARLHLLCELRCVSLWMDRSRQLRWQHRSCALSLDRRTSRQETPSRRAGWERQHLIANCRPLPVRMTDPQQNRELTTSA